MNMIHVSIIIPVYNSEQYIKRCIESLLCQTYCKDFMEIILINDGSTDHSLSIIREYEGHYPKLIRVIDQKNVGVAATRNYGIDIAQGDYIAFVDNDDYLDPAYIETHILHLDSVEIDLIYSGYDRVDSLGQVLFQKQASSHEFSKFVIVAPWARLYRRRFLLDEGIRFLSSPIGEDVYFNLIVYAKAQQVKAIDYIGYHWFYNNESISNTDQKGFHEGVDPKYMLELSLDQVLKSQASNIDLYYYFYVRYIVWYLLFSGKHATKLEFVTQSGIYFQWLTTHFGRYWKNQYIRRKPAGEEWKIWITVRMLLMIQHMRLIRPFSILYCKNT